MQRHQPDHVQTICTSLETDRGTSTPHQSIFTGRMLFLTANQQCQSTEGKTCYNWTVLKSVNRSVRADCRPPVLRALAAPFRDAGNYRVPPLIPPYSDARRFALAAEILLSGTSGSPAEAVEWIEMPSGGDSRGPKIPRINTEVHTGAIWRIIQSTNQSFIFS